MYTGFLPCPFCGKDNKLRIHTRKHRDYPDGLFAVKCTRCGIRGRYQLTEERAIDAWNTRAERTCEMEYITDFMSWHCKACDMMDMAPRNPKPRYCKWCGAKVVE